MENNLSIREILEWYVTAGVDETFGEVPFGLEAPKPKAEPAPRPALTTRAEDSVAPRAATTDLAQATISACKNARELCAEAQTLEELREMVEKFEGCALKLTANKTVFGGGNPNSKIMLVGEAPGADEDRIGLPFVGRSGQLLDKMLKAVNVDRTSCYITNVLPWRQMPCWTTRSRFRGCAANGWSIERATAKPCRFWPVSIRHTCCAMRRRKPKHGQIFCGCSRKLCNDIILLFINCW